MEYKLLKKDVDVIPIYTSTGEKVNEIKLPEKIVPIPSKRGGFAKSGTYYKGSGIIYCNHLVNVLSADEKLIGKTKIIYEKYLVCYPKIVGKFGIFTFPHQAIFSDFEGACGKKEQKLITNQQIFERSAIYEIIDIIPTGIPEHNIYAYRLKNVKGGIKDTIQLIEYVLIHDFNTAWDKNLWGDIYCFGYVRDVADWFVSDKLNHKLGTIYALLNSLYQTDLYLYALLLKDMLGMYTFDKYLIVYFSILIVKKYCPQLFKNLDLDFKELKADVYEKLLTLLFSGRACCHLENEKEWAWVRNYFDVLKSGYMMKFKARLL